MWTKQPNLWEEDPQNRLHARIGFICFKINVYIFSSRIRRNFSGKLPFPNLKSAVSRAAVKHAVLTNQNPRYIETFSSLWINCYNFINKSTYLLLHWSESKYFHAGQQMANTVLTYIFALHFSIAFAQLGFYFYLHENYAVNSVSVKIAYVSDVLLCARACAVDLNCNTATYITAKKRCEMTEERIGNISNKVPVITLKGCFLIEKVRNNYRKK